MLGTLSLTACQKDDVDNGSYEQTRTISHNFTVDANAWGDDSRSAYEEGAGVKVYGNENISVWYADAKLGPNTAPANSMKKDVATGSNFKYTFSHDAIAGAEAYDYYFMMPATTTNSQQSTGKYPNGYLNIIQTPTAESFDPAQDYLAGKPLFDQAEQQTEATVSFKRLFAPVKIVLKNNDILAAGEKIRFVSFVQTGDCTANNPLVGTFYLRFDDGDDVKSDAFEDAVIKSWASQAHSNNIAAYYPEGLDATAEGYPVWLILNPTHRTSQQPTSFSGTLTVQIITDSRIITREITLENPVEFAAGKLNKLTINLNATCDIHEGQTVLTQDFSKTPATDSGWQFNGSYKFQNGGWYVAKESEASISLPAITDKKIVKVIVLPGLYHANNSQVNNLTLSADGTEIETYNFNIQNMQMGTNGSNINRSGYLTIDVPEEYQNAPLTLNRPKQNTGGQTYIRAISVVYEDATAPNAVVSVGEREVNSLQYNITLNEHADKYYYLHMPASETAPTADQVKTTGTESRETTLTLTGLDEATEYTLYVVAANNTSVSNVIRTTAATKVAGVDYLELYNAGQLEINGISYTKETWGEPKEFSTDELTVKDVQAGGIIFLTPGTEPFNFMNNKGEIANINLLKDVVLIGKLSTQQPVINCKRLYCSQNSYAFVNLHLISSDNLFTTDTATDLQTINVSGCTLEPTNHLMAVNKQAPKHFVLDNSIIKLQGTAGIYIVTADNLDTDRAETITISNNVIYTTANTSSANYLIGAGSATRNLKNISINFNHNTIYNLYRNPLVNLYYAKSVSMTYNAIYANYTGDKRFMTVLTEEPEINIGPYIVAENFATKVTKAWGPTHNNNCKVTVTSENNEFESELIPFSTIDTEKGYFPIDKSVVTNGAGASYETKLWNKWE